MQRPTKRRVLGPKNSYPITANFATRAAQLRSKAMDADVGNALRKIEEQQAEVAKALQETSIQLARLDERQQETTNKVNALVVSLNNHYVGALEFGLLKEKVDTAIADWKLQDQRTWLKIEEVEKQRESDRTWFIRTTIGGMVTVGVAVLLTYLKVRGG